MSDALRTLSPADLGTVAADAVTLFLETPPGSREAGSWDDADAVVASVQLGDPPEAAVTVSATAALATRLGTAVLGTAEPDVGDAHDALGELANVIAGGVGAQLSIGGLSLPTVSGGRDLRVRVSGAQTVATTNLDCDGQPLVVALHERIDQQGQVPRRDADRRGASVAR